MRLAFQYRAGQRDHSAMSEHVDSVRMRDQPPQFCAYARRQLIVLHLFALHGGFRLRE